MTKTFFAVMTMVLGLTGLYAWIIVGDLASAGLYYGISSLNFCCYLLNSKEDKK